MQGKFLVKVYNRFIGWAASTLLITAITSLFLLPENTLLDLRFKFRGPTRADTSIVVIAQDESFALNRNDDLDRTPREHLAALVDTLSACGVKTIALYYDFRKDDEADSNFLKLQAAIGRFGKVVVPSLLDTSIQSPDLMDTLPRGLGRHALTGYAELLDNARFTKSYKKLPNTQYEPSFALAAVAAYLMPEVFFRNDLYPSERQKIQGSVPDARYFSKQEWDVVLKGVDYPIDREKSLPIKYAGETRQEFDYLSSDRFLEQIKNGAFSRGRLKGKLILVGSLISKVLGNNRIDTPFGKMAGVEVHANIINNILEREYLKQPGFAWTAFLMSFTLTASVFLMWRLRLLLASIFTLLFLLLYVGVGFVLFISSNLILPVEWPLKVGVAGFFLTYMFTKYAPARRRVKEYTDFHLLVREGKESGSYPVEVLFSPAGETRAEIKFDPDGVLKNSLQAFPKKKVDYEFLKRFGSQLYEALFVKSIDRCYVESLAQARAEKKGLRLRLRFDALKIRILPWEYLYDERNRSFLATNPEILLTRYTTSEQPRRDLTVKELNILVVISDPKSENVTKLDVEHEKELITSALDDLNDKTEIPVNYHILEHAIPLEIQEHLNQGIHVCHFIGHSTFRDGIGQIVLETEKHEAVLTPAADFCELFTGRSDLRLVVLNSCKSAQTSGLREISGLAYQVIDCGVPAVVAMQYSIADETAILFAHEFYRTLANHYPVDFAMAHTRQAILRELKNSWPADFGIPVLFMRSDDGRIL